MKPSHILFFVKFLAMNCHVNLFSGLIKQVVQHRAQLIYTRTTKGDDQAA